MYIEVLLMYFHKTFWIAKFLRQIGCFRKVFVGFLQRYLRFNVKHRLKLIHLCLLQFFVPNCMILSFVQSKTFLNKKVFVRRFVELIVLLGEELGKRKAALSRQPYLNKLRYIISFQIYLIVAAPKAVISK